ncbi:hypothetical protein DI458_33440 [Burkholderia contaminans]|nr:hypothetical protein [Burkholderia contaminans]MBA9838943.1 hypothetical protein [Burkholderia contaminans]MBA9863686.1 hypothetical protein [Burkholderia contaminans]MBA9906369.1 hypothetical protein [Burkholderia contaminans]MBA9929204.1 hypothetical protein [Burkholderia contaminans]
MVPNRLGKRKFIDVSPSGSDRSVVTPIHSADMRPGRQMRARPARMRAGGLHGRGFRLGRNRPD